MKDLFGNDILLGTNNNTKKVSNKVSKAVNKINISPSLRLSNISPITKKEPTTVKALVSQTKLPSSYKFTNPLTNLTTPGTAAKMIELLKKEAPKTSTIKQGINLLAASGQAVANVGKNIEKAITTIPYNTSYKEKKEQDMKDYEATTKVDKNKLLSNYIKQYGDLNKAGKQVSDRLTKAKEKLRDIGGQTMLTNPEQYKNLQREIKDLTYNKYLIENNIGKTLVSTPMDLLRKGLDKTVDVPELARLVIPTTIEYDKKTGEGRLEYDTSSMPLTQISNFADKKLGSMTEQSYKDNPYATKGVQIVSNLLPNIALSIAGMGTLSTLSFVTSAKGSYMQEYEDKGYTYQEANSASNIMAAAELATEVIGGKFGGIKTYDFKPGMLLGSTTKETVANVVRNSLLESLEEGATSIIGITQDKELKTAKEYIKQVGEDSLIGFAMGAFFGTSNIADTVANKARSFENVNTADYAKMLSEAAKENNTTIFKMFDNIAAEKAKKESLEKSKQPITEQLVDKGIIEPLTESTLYKNRGVELKDLETMTKKEINKYVNKENIWQKSEDIVEQELQQFIPDKVKVNKQDTRSKEEIIQEYVYTISKIKESANSENKTESIKRQLINSGYVIETNGILELTEEGKLNPALTKELVETLQLTTDSKNLSPEIDLEQISTIEPSVNTLNIKSVSKQPIAPNKTTLQNTTQKVDKYYGNRDSTRQAIKTVERFSPNNKEKISELIEAGNMESFEDALEIINIREKNKAEEEGLNLTKGNLIFDMKKTENGYEYSINLKTSKNQDKVLIKTNDVNELSQFMKDNYNMTVNKLGDNKLKQPKEKVPEKIVQEQPKENISTNIAPTIYNSKDIGYNKQIEELSKIAYKRIMKNGGVTINKNRVEAKEGLAYSPIKDSELIYDNASEAEIKEYIKNHIEDLQDIKNNIGGWRNPEDGKIYLDISRVGNKDSNTIQEAIDNRQLAVYDLAAGETVEVGKIDEKGGYKSLYEAANHPYIREKQISGRDIQGINTERKSVQESGKSSKKITPIRVDNGEYVVSPTVDNSKVAKILAPDYVFKDKRTVISSIKELMYFYNQKLVNKGYIIDKISDILKKPELKNKFDRTLSGDADAQIVIGEYQTNNNGEKIGNSLLSLFKDSKDAGIYNEYQEYLQHLNNIDRMSYESEALKRLNEFESQNQDIVLMKNKDLIKASKVNDDSGVRAREYLELIKQVNEVENAPVFGENITADVSKNISLELENKYPIFKQWANSYRTFIKNELKNDVDSGLISKDTMDYLLKKHPNYARIQRVLETPVSPTTAYGRNVKILSPIVKAKGSNLDIRDLETVMMEQIVARKKARIINDFGLELLDVIGGSKEYGVEEQFSVKTKEKPNTFTVFKNGEAITMELNDELFDAIKPKQTIKSHIISDVLSKSSSTMRSVLTDQNIFFLVNNVSKDFGDGFFNTKYTKSYIKNYAKGLKYMKENNPLWQQYKGLGGFANTYFKEGQIQKEKSKFRKVTGWPLDKISAVNSIMEQAPRFAEFLSSIENGDSLTQAMYNAADITVNFKRGGDIAKTINKHGGMFFNASLQGFDKFYRNFSSISTAKQSVRLLARATLLGILPAVVNNWFYEDDEEYKLLDDRTKDTYYLIKINGNFIKIPKGRALSVFGAASRATLEKVKGNNRPLEELVGFALGQVAPNNPLESGIWQPIMAVSRSKEGKSWMGTDIVPKRLQGLEKKDQWDENTTSLSKFLGNVLNTSPKKIDYIIQQYSGMYGKLAMPLLTPTAERGVLEKQFIADSTYNTGIDDYFYKTKEELYAKSQGEIKNNKRKSDEISVSSLKNSYINKVSGQVSNLLDAKRKINQSDLSRKDKLRDTKIIQDEINKIQYNALEELKDKDRINYYEQLALEMNKIKDIDEDGIATRTQAKVILNGDYTEDKKIQFFDEFLTKPQKKSIDAAIEEYKVPKLPTYEFYTTINNINPDLNFLDKPIEGSSKAKKTIAILKMNVSDNAKDSYFNLSTTSDKPVTVEEMQGLTHTKEFLTQYFAMPRKDIFVSIKFSNKDVQDWKHLGLNVNEVMNISKNLKGLSSDSVSTRKQKMYDVVNSSNLTIIEKALLLKQQGYSMNEYKAPIFDVINKSNLALSRKKELLDELGIKFK